MTKPINFATGHLIVRPSTHVFLDLRRRFPGVGLENERWYDMSELIISVNSHRFLSGDKHHLTSATSSVDYRSFVSYFLDRTSGGFTWITYEKAFPEHGQVHYKEDPELIKFVDPANDVFVTKQWGNLVLELAELGVREVIRADDTLSGWKGALWTDLNVSVEIPSRQSDKPVPSAPIQPNAGMSTLEQNQAEAHGLFVAREDGSWYPEYLANKG